MKSFGCDLCKKRHFEDEPLFTEHSDYEDDKGLTIMVPKPRALVQLTVEFMNGNETHWGTWRLYRGNQSVACGHFEDGSERTVIDDRGELEEDFIYKIVEYVSN